MPDDRGAPLGRVYAVATSASGEVSVRLAEVPLDGVRWSDGELVGPRVTVASRAVLVDEGGGGVPLPALPRGQRRFDFHPAAGGVRTRDNRLAGGAFNRRIAEAARFGMVNALYHAESAAGYVDHLLDQLGAPPLPRLRVVVGAHSGSRLEGFAQGDADLRGGRRRPFSGGHYRLSQSTSGVPELEPVTPTGEVHLGPGRRRRTFAGRDDYLHNAAHNPAIIYHEFGHHVCRHTADFQVNAERRPERQRNRKTGPEEGFCDYFAASMFGSGSPYGWYRPARGRRRDPGREPDGEWAAESADPHVAASAWSAALWTGRLRSLDERMVRSAEEYDLLLIDALLRVGRVAARPADGRRRGVRAAERSSGRTFAAAFVEAARERCGHRGLRAATEILGDHGRPAESEVGLALAGTGTC